MSQRDEAVMLEQEILEQLKNGGFRLADGLPYGTGEDAEMQYDVTFRELTAGDIIDAQLASERVVETRNGPQLVSSAAQMGVELLRRQISSVGCIKGPLSVVMLKKLSTGDFERLTIASEMKDSAAATKLASERGRVAAVSE
ncbi:phage tail assembly protein [Mixta intestinalis]|jgi:phage FluMu protein gp41|nr:phage tail assembly protein [Mixta intestinalis]